MLKIPLLTRQGEHVVTVVLPPFQRPPEIIVWGQRHFVHTVRHGHGEGGADYLEAMAWFCPPSTTIPGSLDPWRGIPDQGAPDAG